MSKTHRIIINQWPAPSLETFARDLSVPLNTAISWHQRCRIPAPYWTEVVLAARRRGILGVTFEALANAISRKVAA